MLIFNKISSRKVDISKVAKKVRERKETPEKIRCIAILLMQNSD